MSLYSVIHHSLDKVFLPLDSSVTLLQHNPSFLEGRYSSNSSFECSNFVDTPYNDMCIYDFSINTLLNTGFNPKTVFCQSNQIDKVIDSANLISKLINENK